MAKGRKTGGRKKGTKNRRTLARMELAADVNGETPLAVLLSIMRNIAQPPERRMLAAKYAAPYVHPALKAIEHTGPGGGPIQVERVVMIDFEERVLMNEENIPAVNGAKVMSE